MNWASNFRRETKRGRLHWPELFGGLWSFGLLTSKKIKTSSKEKNPHSSLGQFVIFLCVLVVHLDLKVMVIKQQRTFHLSHRTPSLGECRRPFT